MQIPNINTCTSQAQPLSSRRTKTNLPTSSNLLKPSVAEDTLEKDKLRKLKQKVLLWQISKRPTGPSER